jgi:hypothetical protein
VSNDSPKDDTIRAREIERNTRPHVFAAFLVCFAWLCSLFSGLLDFLDFLGGFVTPIVISVPIVLAGPILFQTPWFRKYPVWLRTILSALTAFTLFLASFILLWVFQFAVFFTRLAWRSLSR